MQQILFIHGGDSFSSHTAYIDSLRNRSLEYERLKPSKRWRDWIAEQLPNDDMLTPTMPNGFNAQYDEWVIYFEKLVHFLGEDYTIIGHSLGAMFLAKYLHTHVLPIKARRIALIAGRYGSDLDEDNGSFEVSSAIGLERSTDEIHLFHSEDDPVVPYADMEQFHADLPGAYIHSFKDRKHFNDKTFSEMLDLLKEK